MAKVWVDAYWFHDPAMRAFALTKAGAYEQGEMPEVDLHLSSRAIFAGLIPILEESGFIKPRLDERLRTEDLKIIHRLLDIVDKGTSSG